jgi:hypothetical protein
MSKIKISKIKNFEDQNESGGQDAGVRATVRVRGED